MSEGQRRDGARTSYIGSEVFLSLVDSREVPYSEKIRQLAVEVLVTNRDLPLLMPVGDRCRLQRWRSRRRSTGSGACGSPLGRGRQIAEGEMTWRLINHLSLNYLTMTDLDPAQGATALREFLELYADLADVDVVEGISRRQVQGVRRVTVAPRTRRLPVRGPIVFARGLEIRLTVDETAFAGASAFLLGAVLEQLFGRLASMNTFTELALVSETRGEIKRWPPRMAARQLV